MQGTTEKYAKDKMTWNEEEVIKLVIDWLVYYYT